MFQVSRTPAARLLGAAAVSLASLASLSAAHPAAATGAVASTGSVPAGDHLTVTVRDAGAGADGTFELYCNPGGGTHPDPEGACAAVERDTRWGQDAFAPVPEGSVCTMQYGGPATAHVTGVWAGRPVDVTYDRRDGCEISRWDRMVPLLPEVGARGRS
ncbi:SSI family serine proteinase inhibitor [Streptomyces sp. BPPL-273]|uniref:SSI family serine proteinase inhibitor n=1 Tax=Streptomyces TaxID=1883 RepID=UPI00210907A3|nr:MULTISPECIES: SSI family serine proteinase inhibitor [Streptomyces]MCQ4197556.1 subtilase-type protease inhibitor [Streptomyces parvulus]WHM32032.1 SSI family serine proteinase inhibitor [Streptomyces sp. BPPL-273]